MATLAIDTELSRVKSIKIASIHAKTRSYLVSLLLRRHRLGERDAVKYAGCCIYYMNHTQHGSVPQLRSWPKILHQHETRTFKNRVATGTTSHHGSMGEFEIVMSDSAGVSLELSDHVLIKRGC